MPRVLSGKDDAPSSSRLARYLRTFADHLATPAGFFWTQGVSIAFLPAGWLFGFSDGWQLVWTLFLSEATFIIGGIILVAQNHDEEALHAKMDEVIRALPQARNELIGAEKEE